MYDKADWIAPSSFDSTGFGEIKEISFKFDSTWPTNEIGEKRLKNWEKFGECYKKDYRMMK